MTVRDSRDTLSDTPSAPSTDAAAMYGDTPGEHNPDCAFVVNRWNCNCPYAKNWLSDLDDVVSLLIAKAVHDGLFEAWGDLPDLPRFVFDAARKRALARVGSPHTDDYEGYERLSQLSTEEA